MTPAHFRQSKIKLKWHPVLRRKRCCFIQRELSNSGSDKELGPFSICDVIETKWLFYILSFDAVDAVNLECDTRLGGQGTRNKWLIEHLYLVIAH